MPRTCRLLSAGLLIATLTACAGDGTPTPTIPQPAATAAPTEAAVATVTPIPAPPAAAAPSPSPAPATPTPLPTSAAAPAGAPAGGADPIGPTATPTFPERQITAATVGQLRLLRTVGFGRALAAALSPDKQRLAVATSAGLAVFSYPDFRHLRFDRIPSGAANPAWTADGLAIEVKVSPPGGDSMIETRDAATGELVGTRTFEYVQPEYPITIDSPDGVTQAVFNVPDSSPTPGVRISRGGQQIYADDVTESLSFSADGALAALVAFDGRVRVRDLAAGAERELDVPGFWGAAFSADGQRLITSERQLMVWDVVSGAQLSSAPIAAAAEPWIVNASQRIRHLPDGSALLLDGDYSFFEGGRRIGDVWSAGAAPQLKATAKIAGIGITNFTTYAGAVSAAGAGAATTDGTALEFYNGEGNVEATVDVPERITTLEYAPDGGLLAVATEEGPIELLGAGREPAGSYASDQPIEAMRFSADGSMLAGMGRDGKLRIWRRGAQPPAGDAPALAIPGFSDDIYAWGDSSLNPIFSADGAMLALADGDGVRFFSLGDGALLHTLPGPAVAVDIGPRQRAIAVLRDGYVELWGLE